MSINLFQLVALTSLFYFSIVSLYSAKGKSIVAKFYYLRWSFIAFVGFILVFHPSISTKIADFFGIKRGVDIVIYFAFIWTLYKIKALEDRIIALNEKFTDFVRKQALEEKR